MSRACRTDAVFAVAFLLASMSGADARAATEIFHSPGDNGVPAVGPPTVAEGGVQPVYLYIDGGPLASAPGTACDSGSGNEVCGFTATLTGLDGLTISAFVPDGGANLLVNETAGSIVINGLDPGAPTPGAKRIGEVHVNAVPGSSLELSTANVVGADLTTEGIGQTIIAQVPEPGLGSSLFFGSLALVGLARRKAVA